MIRSEAIADYLREHTGAPIDRPYISLSLDLNFQFDWRSAGKEAEFYRNPTVHVADLLRDRPNAQVLVLGGCFDLATPLAASRYAITHAGLPPDRTKLLPLLAGHSLDATVLPTAAAGGRQLITDTAGGVGTPCGESSQRRCAMSQLERRQHPCRHWSPRIVR